MIIGTQCKYTTCQSNCKCHKCDCQLFSRSWEVHVNSNFWWMYCSSPEEATAWRGKSIFSRDILQREWKQQLSYWWLLYILFRLLIGQNTVWPWNQLQPRVVSLHDSFLSNNFQRVLKFELHTKVKILYGSYKTALDSSTLALLFTCTDFIDKLEITKVGTHIQYRVGVWPHIPKQRLRFKVATGYRLN